MDGLHDLGNAERLRGHYGDRVRYCPEWGTWLAWDTAAGVWRPDPKGVLVGALANASAPHLAAQAAAVLAGKTEDPDALAVASWAKHSLSATGRRNAVDQASTLPRLHITPADLDQAPAAAERRQRRGRPGDRRILTRTTRRCC